jgi:RimJ/RimL family protein N-acetyltransferase
MELLFVPTTLAHVEMMLTWRYAPPYHMYNIGADDAEPGDVEAAMAYFTDPVYGFYSLLAKLDRELVGVASFGLDGQVPGGDYMATALDIGLAIAPEWTGRGYGRCFVQQVIAFAECTFQPPRLRVTIAEFNQRAQTVWRHAGFQLESSFVASHDERPYLIFVLDMG